MIAGYEFIIKYSNGMHVNVIFECYIQLSDKDECAGSNNCQQKCVDGVGTYTCACNTGYKLNETDLVSCLRKLNFFLKKLT